MNQIHPYKQNELLGQMHTALVTEIDYYLKDRGLTRSQFAEQLGVSKGYVSQLLNGVQDFKMSSLINLALAIDKDPVLILADKQRRAYVHQDTISTVADEKKEYGGDRIHKKVNWEAIRSLPILETTRQMKEEVDSMRPFSRNMENHVLQQYLRIWNYNSNAIEGNKLDYGETLALLLYGLTAKGKPLKDHLEVVGHQEAVELMLEMVKGDRGLTQHDIRQLHQVMLKEDYQQRAVRPDGQEVFRTIHVGRYKLEPNHVVTLDGTVHFYAKPSAVPGLMTELTDWYEKKEREHQLHPLLLASIFHHEFVAIHPFDDGNGRMGRIIMNFALMRGGYPVAVVPVTNRMAYYDALQEADEGNYVPIVQFIGGCLQNSLDAQLATARGEDISGSKWDTPNDDPR